MELFAGVGGFRLALERSSPEYEVVWANQWEPSMKAQYAFDCYQKNFGASDTHVNEDISKVKDHIPDHDLLVGGFPCQDYSVARTQAKGIEGKKGVLWWHIRDIIERKGPKYVLLENVDRLIRSPSDQRGRDFGIILRCLADLGYIVEWRVINAAEYGFVQRRRRVFIFAYNKESALYNALVDDPLENILKKKGFFAKPFPVDVPSTGRMNTFTVSKRKYQSLADLSDNFTERLFNGGVMVNHDVYTKECLPIHKGENIILEDILEEDVDSKYYIQNTEKWEYLKGSKRIDRVSRSGIRYVYSEGNIAFPDPLDKPGRTMLTSEGTLNRSTHIINDGKGHRILTPIECERMNGFDDDWTRGCMSERFRYFAMGNALVVPLVERLGKRLIEIDSKK